MAVKPIPMQPESVRAILAGRKTQTRRVLSPSNSEFGSAPRDYWDHADFSRAFVDGKPESGQYLHVPCHTDQEDECPRCAEMGWEETVHRLWPRCEPGDLLWVREAHLRRAAWHIEQPGGPIWYLADGEPSRGHWQTRTRPSIHMPRWSSRLTLRVAAVKVERVQDISEADAKAEGAQMSWASAQGRSGTWRQGFHDLWDSINARRPGCAWADNPWVAAIEFTAISENIDTVLAREAA